MANNGGSAVADAMAGTAAGSGAATAAPPGPGPVIEPTPLRRWPLSPSREGRKAVVVHVDPKGFRELKILALDLDRPLQSMMIEAIDDYLERHDRPRCANGLAEPAAE